MMQISAEIDRKSLRDIEKKLGDLKSEAPKVLMRAINDTAKKAQDDLYREAKSAYTIKMSAFKSKTSALKLKRANSSNLTAYLQSEGAPLALYGYKVKANAASTKAQVKQSSSLKALEVDGIKAFVATMSSGHTGVFQRGETGERFPIHQKFSSSIPKIIGDEKEVYGKVEPDIQKRLMENVEKEISKLLAWKGGK